jgi:hypothetical protein
LAAVGAIRSSRKFQALSTSIWAVNTQFFRNFRKVEWNLQASRENVKENLAARVPKHGAAAEESRQKVKGRG